MHAWEQIQQTIEYIEQHLGEEISIEELAGLAALSPFYYQRLFSRLVKKPVAEYVKLRRLAKAADALLTDDRRILDIALDLGFSSHEHFTRSFRETFGLTPRAYRSAPRALNRMTKPELLLHYALIDEGVPLITEGIVLEINRRALEEPLRFIGKSIDLSVQYLEGLGVESGPDPLDDLWQDFHAQKRALGLQEDSEEIGVTSASALEGCFHYFAGAMADGAEPPEGYAARLLPAGEYVVCVFEADRFERLVMDALYKAQQYLYGVWLPKHGLETLPFCAERYKSHGPQTTAMEVWLQLKD